MRHLALACLLMVCAASPVAAQPFTKRYLMALHTCTTDCANPQTHTARIVESDDGQQWTPVPNVPLINASVPDLLIRGDKLYLYSPGRLMRYNRTTNTWQASVNVTIRDTQNQMVPFVDPSPTLDEQGRIVLFFLRGNIGQGDPASCNPYPCIKQFGSAVEVAGSDGAEFVLQTGWRAEINLTAGVLADPDISFDGRRYVLLISAGPNTLAYTATQLHGAYQPVAGLTNALLTNGGGVPSSYFDAATQQYWVFTHSDIQGRTVIRRAMQSTLERALTPNQFETIITAERFGLNATASAASPGFTVNTWLPNAASSNVSAASFRRDPFAAEMICAAFGNDLAKVALSAASTPLPNTLAGTTLKLKDNAGSERAAPLFFVSPTQINFLLPTGTVNGAATLTITNADGLVSTSALDISTVAPGLFSATNSLPSGRRTRAFAAESATVKCAGCECMPVPHTPMPGRLLNSSTRTFSLSRATRYACG